MKIDEVSEIESHEYRVHAAAIFYAERRIPIVPIVPNGKALPPRETGVNYNSASFNLKTIEKWFHPVTGKFRGFNIGIACGKEHGFFALDVDVRGEHDGQSNLEKTLKEEKVELSDCPTAMTPNKGKHYLFKWAEGAVPSTDKIAKGIDTRGGIIDKYKSHIVVFPSIINQKMYAWEYWTNDIPTVPEWIVRRLGKMWQDKSKGNRGNENVGVDDLEQLIPEEQLIRMLDSIDPNNMDYEQWLKIGMAIKSQYPEEDGLDLWDAWSQKGERYKEGECEIRWDGFSETGTVRAGTLFWHAQQEGWEPEKKDKKGNTSDKIVAEMNEKYAVILIGGKLRILYEKWNPLEIEPNFTILDRDSFTGLLGNQIVVVNSGSKQKEQPLSQIWLAHEGRRTYENGLALFPNEIAASGYFNTWNGFAIEPKKGDCELFLEHIRTALCSEDAELYEWLLDWIADMFQDPGNPKGCAVVMRGPEGAGKGALANTLGKLFGPHYRHLIDDRHLTSNFNAHMIDCICVFADEITWGGNKKSSGKLKGLITEEVLLGERKGIDVIPYKNMTHLMIASNGEWVIPAGTNSRRWFVLDVNNKYTRDRLHFNKLFKAIDSREGRSAILHFFLNRMITSDLRRAPETRALHTQQMLNACDDTVFNWYRERILAGNLGALGIDGSNGNSWPINVRRMDLYEAYRTRILDGREQPVRENVFGRRIKELGVGSSRVREGSSRVYVYAIPSTPAIAIQKLNEAMPGAVYEDDEN